MPLILKEGYENSIRNKMGVRDGELIDSDINDKFVLDISEAYIVKRVPNYSKITDPIQQLYLENATVCYICYMLGPSMDRRLNDKVSTLDLSWQKQKVDWEEKALEFLAECDNSLAQITEVEVAMEVAQQLVKVSSNNRLPIGTT